MASTPKALAPKDVEKKFKAISEWQLNKKGTELSKTFAIDSFIKGLSFIAKIAVHAEIMQHHPDVTLSYTKVKVTLTTHDVKGLTQKDFDLAKRIDNLKSE